jgi:metal-responsive CopG/Arc/MetJ family transcriptional regulator
MKTTMSVTLSDEILVQVDTIAADGDRSGFIEKALWKYVESTRGHTRARDDFDILNNESAHLNEEAEDALLYQVAK